MAVICLQHEFFYNEASKKANVCKTKLKNRHEHNLSVITKEDSLVELGGAHYTISIYY
jgi:hypothetical protein